MEISLKIERVDKPEKRGGARAGAGRKKQENGRNISVGLSLSKKAYDVLERLANEGHTTKNDVINKMLEFMDQ